MNAPAALFEHQQALQAWLLRGDGAIASSSIDATPVRHETVHDRLRLYRDAYALRLVEVLGQDFPALKALFGDDAFAALAMRYLMAHPSTQPSVRHFGALFPRWLSQQHAVDPAAAELACFEWAQGEVFDAADATGVALSEIAGVPPQDWPRLCLELAPHLRLLTLSGNAPAQVAAHAAGDAIPASRMDGPSSWLLWRADFAVHWRRLDVDEADALVSVQAGHSFGALCAQLAPHHGPEAPLRAASLLKRWTQDGLVTALHLAPPAIPS